MGRDAQEIKMENFFFIRNYSDKLFADMVGQMKDKGVPSYDRAVEARKTLDDLDFYNVQG